MRNQNVFRSQYRELNEDEKKLLEDIKNKALELYELMDGAVCENPSPKGRHIALGKTSLEESVMWAVKGITS